MHIHEVVNEHGLAEAIAAKYVKRQFHPTEPLAILNYSQTCMFDKAWTPITRACRGLIYRTDTGEVVARPFRKFFNHGELQAGTLDMAAAVEVTDKADGSLGILYPLPSGGHAIATRGSFVSDQAQHATWLWRNRYVGHDTTGTTLLFEIVYASNRIVLDYGDLDDLLFLAAIDVATGRTIEGHSWPFGRVQAFPFRTLAAALQATPRANAEGLVVRFSESDERVKIKQDDYVALHRVMTGTSPRRLWEFLCVNACKTGVADGKHWQKLGMDPARADQILAAGDNWREAMLSGVPDEFFAWVGKTIAEVERAVEQIRIEVLVAHQHFEWQTHDRKQFALAIKDEPHKSALFMLVDAKPIDTYCWKAAYPAADRAWMNRSEDVA